MSHLAKGYSKIANYSSFSNRKLYNISPFGDVRGDAGYLSLGESSLPEIAVQYYRSTLARPGTKEEKHGKPEVIRNSGSYLTFPFSWLSEHAKSMFTSVRKADKRDRERAISESAQS